MLSYRFHLSAYIIHLCLYFFFYFCLGSLDILITVALNSLPGNSKIHVISESNSDAYFVSLDLVFFLSFSMPSNYIDESWL